MQAAPGLASFAVDEPTATTAAPAPKSGGTTKRKRDPKDDGETDRVLSGFREKEAKIVTEYYDEQKKKEKLECLKVRLHILCYATRFKDTLEGMMKEVKWDEMSLTEHNDLLFRVQFAVANRNAGALEEGVAEVGLGFMEAIIAGAGFEVAGPDHHLTELAQDPAFKDSVAEVQLYYMQLFYSNPIARLLGQLGHGIWSIHAANSLSNKAREDSKTLYENEVRRQANLEQSVQNLNGNGAQ